jgi:hypothetical protein
MGTLSAQDVKFLVVDLDNSLQANTDYALKLKGTAGTAKVPFDDADFKFSTKPKATIAPPVEENVADYRYGEKLWVTSNVALDKSSENQVRFKSEDAPGVFVPHAAAVHIPDSTPDMGFARYAIAELSFSDGDTPKQFNSRLAVTGLKDIFGSEVEIENTQKRIAPASSLKGER